MADLTKEELAIICEVLQMNLLDLSDLIATSWLGESLGPIEETMDERQAVCSKIFGMIGDCNGS